MRVCFISFYSISHHLYSNDLSHLISNLSTRESAIVHQVYAVANARGTSYQLFLTLFILYSKNIALMLRMNNKRQNQKLINCTIMKTVIWTIFCNNYTFDWFGNYITDIKTFNLSLSYIIWNWLKDLSESEYEPPENSEYSPYQIYRFCTRNKVICWILVLKIFANAQNLLDLKYLKK